MEPKTFQEPLDLGILSDSFYKMFELSLGEEGPGRVLIWRILRACNKHACLRLQIFSAGLPGMAWKPAGDLRGGGMDKLLFIDIPM